MLRLLCALTIALALFVVPASVTPQISGQAQAETAATKEDGKDVKAKKKAKQTEDGAEDKKAKKKTGKKKERTPKQKAAAERMKRCGAEYQEAKKSGKLGKGENWKSFRKGCLARLKKQET
jgi:hypothetical protein